MGVADRFMRFGDGVPLSTVIENMHERGPLVPKAVRTAGAERYARWACVRTAEIGRPLSLVQLFWSDEEPRYPWIGGYDHRLDELQPPLYR